MHSELERPPLAKDAPDLRITVGPVLTDNDKDKFMEEFQQFITELAVACNWHKHLKKGETGGNSNCRMQIDGSTQAVTDLDPDTMSILLH